jgi:hypothetical protein
MQRSNWARGELKRMMELEGDVLDLLAVHDAAVELDLASPLMAMRASRSRAIDRTVKVAGRLTVPVPEKRSTAGFVYVIRSGNRKYKIGSSRSPYFRLSQLQTGSPKKMKLIIAIRTDFRQAMEARVHQTLAHKRIGGEWFNLGKEDLAWLRSLKKAAAQTNGIAGDL